MILNKKLQNQIKEQCHKELPFESCGLLILDKNNNIIYCSCKNSSCFDKLTHFELDILDYLKASKLGKIIALVHSQENLGASELDKINSKIHNIKSIIYSWGNDSFFEVGDSNLEKYIGRKFDISTNNCYTLIQDYFRNELKIVLNNYNLSENWYEKNPKIILDNFEKEGGIKVSKEDMKKNDVLFFDLLKRGIPHHMGIYLGDGSFIHHPREKKSIIEFIDNWNKYIVKIIRHKKLV